MVATRKRNTTGAKSRRKRTASGAVQTYETLRALIISGEFSPGAALDENELVNRFPVSRTPVREALIRLSMEGLVSMAPSRGAKVSNLNFSDITDHLEVMDILTPSICYLAALRRTPVDLNAIETCVDRLNAVRRDELSELLDAIFQLYTNLGKATHNNSLSEVYRLAIYAKLRIAKVSAARSETDKEWEAHKAQLQDVYIDIYNSIANGQAHEARLAATRWMSLIRERLSRLMSSSPTQELDVQLQRRANSR